MSNQSIHLVGLNGIRAIAAIAVVLSHINLGLGSFHLPPIKSIDLAGHGVTIFFALSGFLITFLLIHEKQKQPIIVKKFYLRRILRIWPLYFLYLFVTILVTYQSSFTNEILKPTLIYYIFFAANIPFIFDFALPLLGHFWTIGVEEQFYLFWPWLIKNNRLNTLRTVVVFAGFLILLRLICRFIEYKWGNPYPYLIIHVNRFDCMAVGGIGAILFLEDNKIFKKIVYLKVTQILSWFVIFLLAFNSFHIASVIDPEIISIVTVVIIINVSSNTNTIINLNKQIFDFLGKISYGIYIIHPLVIFLFAKFLNLFELHNLTKYILIYTGVLALTIAIAYVCFRYFESKFIKLKENFSVIKSSSIKQI